MSDPLPAINTAPPGRTGALAREMHEKHEREMGEAAGDVCTCMHSRDWHHDRGCNAFATDDRSCGARCMCEGFVLHHTAEADRLARTLRSAIDRMESNGAYGQKTMYLVKRYIHSIEEGGSPQCLSANTPPSSATIAAH